MSSRSPFLILAFCGLSLYGCGGDISSSALSPQSCVGKTAQVTMASSFLQITCGCAEAPNTVSEIGQVLSCTIPAGTTVVFEYAISSGRTQQILSTGDPSFQSGPILAAQTSSTNRLWLVPFNTPGTYNFQDSFFPALQGKIVVQ